VRAERRTPVFLTACLSSCSRGSERHTKRETNRSPSKSRAQTGLRSLSSPHSRIGAGTTSDSTNSSALAKTARCEAGQRRAGSPRARHEENVGPTFFCVFSSSRRCPCPQDQFPSASARSICPRARTSDASRSSALCVRGSQVLHFVASKLIPIKHIAYSYGLEANHDVWRR